MVEMYAATLDVFEAHMPETFHSAFPLIIYVKVDVWKSNISGVKLHTVRGKSSRRFDVYLPF